MSEKNTVVVQPPQSKGLTPAESLRNDLTKMSSEFQRTLPANVTPDKFLRVVLNTVMGNPDFLKCDRTSLFQAAMKCAGDGLLPDGREAVMIPYGNTCQYQPMIFGIYKRVRNSGEISVFCADLVFPGDTFRYGSNSEKGRYLDHQPLLSERGKMDSVVAVFALSRTTDGDVDFEVMTRAEVEFTRSKAKAKNSPAWSEWWGEMAKKTVAKRLSKRLPMSDEARKVLDRDDEDYDVQLKPLSRAEQLRAKLAPKDDVIETQGSPVEGDFANFSGAIIGDDPKAVK